MPEVFISAGSNVDREASLRAGCRALAARYGPLRASPVYESPAFGFDGDPFYNLVLAWQTDEPAEALVASLREVEAACGRTRSTPRFSARTLDLDLLLYGDALLHDAGLNVPRDEIEQHPFVLKPLLDLLPDGRHPATGTTFASLWAAMSAADLRRVALDLPLS